MQASANALQVVGYLTKDEVERFFRAIPAANLRDRLLFDLMYRHALRRGEAVLLRREHIVEGRIWISRLKNGLSGSYPLHPKTERKLVRYLETRDDENPFLFPSRIGSGKHLSTSHVYGLYRRYAEAAELPFRLRHPHVLRHSNPTHQLTAGADLADVKDWMGHREIASTVIYAQITNKRRENHYARMRASKEIADL